MVQSTLDYSDFSLLKQFICSISSSSLNVLCFNPAIALLVIYPTELKIYVHTKTCTPLFIASSFMITKTWNRAPWWRSGWESACQCRGHGFEPWSGKIPHAAEQLSPWATTAEPAHLEPVLRNRRGHDSERPAHCDEEWPPLAATRESPRAEMKTQHSQK